MKLVLLGVGLWGMPPSSAKAASPQPGLSGVWVAPGVEVLKVESGHYIPNQYGMPGGVFIPTSHLRMRLRDGYGWRVHLRTDRSRIRWSEEVVLPSRPEEWGITSDVKLWSDRRAATTTMVAVPKDGLIENFWFFAKGDPLGTYRMRVMIEGVEIGEFHFDVQAE